MSYDLYAEEPCVYVDDIQDATIINLTKNDIYLKDDYGNFQMFPAAKGKNVLKIEVNHEVSCFINNIEVTKSVATYDVDRLPPKLPNTYYIVTSMVAEIYRERDDFLCCFVNKANIIVMDGKEIRFSKGFKQYGDIHMENLCAKKGCLNKCLPDSDYCSEHDLEQCECCGLANGICICNGVKH